MKPKPNQPFNKRLKMWREGLDISQRRAAELLSVNRRTYEAWEQGANEPSIYAIKAIESLMVSIKSTADVEP